MRLIVWLLLLGCPTVAVAAEPAPLKLLFLGDNAGHQPASRFRLLQPVLAQKGIELTYTDQLDAITLPNLNKYDGLVIYANHGRGTAAQVQAILDYVASGKGFIPLHCASYCFIDNPAYVELVGAQFRSHTVGVFRVENVAPKHPIMVGFEGFESWDETYTHTRHNEKNRTVLEVRTDGDVKEPWTWTRTHGQGRVFYTAWGHDARTWTNSGFHNLVERGIRWACGQEPSLAGVYVDAPPMKPIKGDVKDFEYMPAKVPFYPPSKQWGTIADPISKMQKPLSPEKSMTHYTMPADFELQLFASEEQFGGGKPISMTWDERGRLWVALTYDYPNELQPPGQGRDKIVVLEDTTGDNRADKITVFAEKLSIPTSLLCVQGGLLVHQAPETLFLKDIDGDGQADLRQVVMSGWSTGDTHAGPSNLRYGHDNWVYGSVGYAGFNGTIAGEKQNFRQGYYRFKLQAADKGVAVSKFEFLRSTSNNTWGLALNEAGELFGSTANGCVLVHAPIPNRYYEKVRGLSAGVLPPIALDNRYHPVTTKIRQVDWHGGFTSAAGCAIYTARAYPSSYWNRTAFVSDPTGHLTATFVLQPSGSDYIARYGWNLVASQDEWAAPIEAHVGPDGMVWVLDWYNYIVQHNPTPQGFRTGKGNAYETELRDKKYGRVYRVVYTGAKAEKPVTLKNATPEQLVQTLKHSNMFWRLQAQRLLVERGQADIKPQLDRLLDEQESNPLAALHAAWVYASLNEPKELGQADRDRWLRVARGSSPATQQALLRSCPDAQLRAELAAVLLDSKDPTVRTAALLALSDTPDAVSNLGSTLLKAMRDATHRTDRNNETALQIACRTHPLPVLTAIAREKAPLPRDLLPLVEQVASELGTRNADAMPTVLNLIVNLGDEPTRSAMITGLVQGWPARKTITLDEAAEKSVMTLLSNAPASSRGKLLKLASSWGVKGLNSQLAEITRGLLQVVAKGSEPDAARLDAARQLLEFRPADDDVAKALIASISQPASPLFVSGILEVLGESQSKAVGPALVAQLTKLPPSARSSALRLVLARPESTRSFLDAVEKGSLRFDMLALDQKTALAAHPEASIADRAKKLLAMGGGLPDPDRQKVIVSLHGILEKTGDVANGKKLFTQHCAKCHKHGGEGQQIGPDLTGFAVHPKEEILIHVLDPSRSVEGNYRTYTAKLIDGRIITGLLAAESRTTVELLDAENKRFAINRDDLEEFTESVKSLMPEGFEKQMNPTELTDLLEFLTQKGKFVPVPLDKFATIVSTKGMFFADEGEAERLIFRDWKPKSFNGVPFVLTDPQGDKLKNVILLNGPNGVKAPKMPKQVTIPANTKAAAVHLLSGIGGWSYPASGRGSVSMIVRFHYADGTTEDHELKNGIHFADYIRKVDVPGSQFAFALRGQQVRYLSVKPKRSELISKIDFIKGPDVTAPVIMAVTIETP